MAVLDLGRVVGPAGQSAYEAAVAGGYTGTEAEFREKLAAYPTADQILLPGSTQNVSTALSQLRGGTVNWIRAVNTNDEIAAAINEAYNATKNDSVTYATLSINTHGLVMESGKWLLMIYRVTNEHGAVFAVKYGFSNGVARAKSKSKYNGVWGDWVDFAWAQKPTWINLLLSSGITGDAAYYKDQFGLVHVYIGTATQATPGHNMVIGTLPVGYRPIKNISGALIGQVSPGDSLDYTAVRGVVYSNGGISALGDAQIGTVHGGEIVFPAAT